MKEQMKHLTVLVTRTDCRLLSNESRYPQGFVYLELRILLKMTVGPVGKTLSEYPQGSETWSEHLKKRSISGESTSSERTDMTRKGVARYNARSHERERESRIIL